MKKLQKRLYAAAGYATTFFGKGRSEFAPGRPMPPFEKYLEESASGTQQLLKNCDFDEGVIGSFMASRFIKQANLPGFLPHIVPSLYGKPCVAVEGACGTGGRAIAAAARGILAGLSDLSFVIGFEIQNSVKAIYGADILAGAAYYSRERKEGHAYFFPTIFASRAGAYYEKYGYDKARRAMATWYENAILNARKNPKAQEYENRSENLFELAMSPPNPEKFIPHLNYFDCSKVSDGAASIALLSEEGMKRCGVEREQCIEIVAIGEAEGDITKKPDDPTHLSITEIAAKKALLQAGIALSDIGLLELHDCFTITALLAIEAIGLAPRGEAPAFVCSQETSIEGKIPTNLSGGLGGFGHPTGATGVRQLVDLHQQLIGKAPNQADIEKPYGMMVSMGGDDKTVSCIIARR